MAEFMLIVKGNAEEAVKAAEQHGVSARIAEAVPGRRATILYVEDTSLSAVELTYRLNVWLTEGHTGKVPFPTGTLMWWK